MTETQETAGVRKGGAGKPILFCLGSLAVLSVGIYVWLELSLASSLWTDSFFALAFSAIYVAITFPVLATVGFLGRMILERLSKRRFRHRQVMPWVIPTALGLGMLVAALAQSRSARTMFRRFLNEEPPASVSGFHTWWATLPGDSLYAMSFNVNPAEFDSILAGHTFVKVSDPYEIKMALAGDLALPAFDLPLPKGALTTLYKFENTDHPAPVTIHVYTTSRQDEVLIWGDN